LLKKQYDAVSLSAFFNAVLLLSFYAVKMPLNAVIIMNLNSTDCLLIKQPNAVIF